ncbi:GNAT family N-acetyltransferase [Vibrio neptunius]|uniref:GNAT family N-acetyltransferase n=1 Tax=Vibrio neptunius TaxID=170651 RepID=UPI0019D204A0|nr:GNAT family N-acetyltransferase [Vibrio neptunius]
MHPAQKLLEKAKSILNNRNEVRLKLTVYSDNTEAIKAYEKSGFIDVSSVENELFMTFEP